MKEGRVQEMLTALNKHRRYCLLMKEACELHRELFGGNFNNDPGFYDNLQKILEDVESLARDLQEHQGDGSPCEKKAL